MSMLRNNNIYYYNDRFMYFTFGNIHSSKYNLFIVNNGDDIKTYNNSGASNDYVSPKYYDGAILLGTTRSQREFPFTLAAEGLTALQVKQIAKWLEVGSVGKLVLDDDPDWSYTVVVDELGDMNTYVQHGNKYIVEFNVKFKTIGTYLATNSHDIFVQIQNNDLSIAAQSANNSMGIPVVNLIDDVENNQKHFRIIHLGNEYSYINYTTTFIPYPYDPANKVWTQQSAVQLKIAKTKNSSNADAECAVQFDMDSPQIQLDADLTYYSQMQYYGDMNIITLDRNFIEEKYRLGIIDNLNISYKASPLKLYSAIEPIKLTNFINKTNVFNAIGTYWAQLGIDAMNNPIYGLFYYNGVSPVGVSPKYYLTTDNLIDISLEYWCIVKPYKIALSSEYYDSSGVYPINVTSEGAVLWLTADASNLDSVLNTECYLCAYSDIYITESPTNIEQILTVVAATNTGRGTI